MIVEVQFEARAVDVDSVIDLRPVPVWCALPRDVDDPKVTCVGWVAGRQVARTEGHLVTTTWCRVEVDPPADLVSRPPEALRTDRLPADAGRLWVLSRRRSLDWLGVALATKRRFRSSLDLGAINERRAAAFAGARGKGPLRPPLFGRGWWIPNAEEGSLQDTTLGALEDRFVLIERGGSAVPDALDGEVEEALGELWRDAHS
jgi:hypothetical protein